MKLFSTVTSEIISKKKQIRHQKFLETSLQRDATSEIRFGAVISGIKKKTPNIFKTFLQRDTLLCISVC